MIIIHSLLLHSCFLLVYETTYGFDSWVHMGKAKRLLDGIELYPPMFGGKAIELGPLKISEIFMHPKMLTAMFKSLIPSLTRMLQFDLIPIYISINYVLSSLFIPVFLYQIGRWLYPKDQRYALMLSITPILFRRLIGYASLTVPVGLGTIDLLFCILLWFRYFKNKNKSTKFVLAPLFVFLTNYFSYPTAAIYSLELTLSVFLTGKMKKLRGKLSKYFYLAVFLTFMSLAVPFVDTIQNTYFNQYGIKDIILVCNKFLSHYHYRYLSKFETLIPTLFTVIGVVGLRKKIASSRSWMVIAIMLVVTQLNFVIVWQYMTGGHPVGRRISSIMYLFMSPFIAFGIMSLMRIKIFVENRDLSKLLNVSICLLITISSLFAYISGPGYENVIHVEDLEALKYIVNDAKRNYCIIADKQMYELHHVFADHIIFYRKNTHTERIEFRALEIRSYNQIVKDEINVIDKLNYVMNKTRSTLCYLIILEHPPAGLIDILNYTRIGRWYIFKYERMIYKHFFESSARMVPHKQSFVLEMEKIMN